MLLHPHVNDNEHSGSARRPLARRHLTLALGSVVALVALAGGGLAATGAAFADSPATSSATAPGSYARGQFLSGAVAGLSLDDLLALQSAEARNSGSPSTVTEQNPLTLAILKKIQLGAPNGVQLNLGDVINAGVLSQYAQAKSTGSSHAASGAVTNEGAIGTGSATPGGSLSVDLETLLGARFASVISSLKLQVQAVAAQATGTSDSVGGTYSLAGLTLSFTSPALANLSSKVTSALAPASASISGLTGANGSLVGTVSSLLTRLSPVLAVTGTTATASASLTTDLQAAVAPLLTANYSTPGITLNLATGSVVVDLNALTGGQLNNQPANTELLSGAVVASIVKAITTQISSIADQINNRVTQTLLSAQVAVDVNVSALSPTAAVPAVPGIPAVAPVLCTALQLLNLCKNSTGSAAVAGIPAIAAGVLRSTATVHVRGSVDQILRGTATSATAAVSLLGGTVAATLTTNQVLSALAAVLKPALLSNTGAAGAVASGLVSRLVTPATAALTGNTSSVSSLLGGLLSLTVNVKETTLSGGGLAVPTGTLFTETALRVRVLKNVGTGTLATINLAQAAVAPRTAVLLTPPTPPTGDPVPTATPTVGPPSTPPVSGCNSTRVCLIGDAQLTSNDGNPTVSAAGRLAYTGVALGGIIFALLALLAAGAWLAREGYRRNKAAVL